MLSLIDIAPEAFGEPRAEEPLPAAADAAVAGESHPGSAEMPAATIDPTAVVPYAVRVSERAKRARLTVTPRDGLVVVIPKRYPRRAVPGLVAEHREWAIRALAHVAERHAVFSAGAEAMMPERIAFPATGESFRVVRVASAADAVRVTMAVDEVRLVGGVDDAEACLAALNRWLDRAAKERLVPRATALARIHGFSPATIRSKRQKTRWGSCSARGTIALNRTLLFLPPELCDAVILHELVHTRRLDHSPRFWAELATVDPGALEHRARLREAGALVPPWADV